MDAETLTKLRRHVENTGRYEPTIVRPHPTEKNKFQVINGHHRLRVLKAMGRASVKCMVWDVDDVQTRLYLATLNRLSGEDTPERRTLLIGSLLESFGLDELAELLPESHDQLVEFERLANIDPDELMSGIIADEESPPKIILEFFLDHDAAKEVNLALDVIAHRHPELGWRSQALVHLARSYLSAKEPRRTVSPASDGEVGTGFSGSS